MFLFMSIKVKMNFYQFGRYGNHGEQRYRQQYEKQFNFIDFNINLTKTYGSGNFAIAAIDIDNNTAFHLEAVQTPNRKKLNEGKITLVDFKLNFFIMMGNNTQA